MSPQPKAPAADTPAALEPGQHNPYLAGLLNQGQEIEDAIKGWYAQREAVRTQARGAVAAGFASDEQKEAVAKLYPMPKRKKKDDKEGEGAATSNASA